VKSTIKKRFIKQSVSQIECVAYHEAGHAYIMWRNQVPINKVSIISNENILGFVRKDGRYKYKFENSDGSLRMSEFVKFVLIDISGVTCEALFSGKFNFLGGSSDYNKLLEVLTSYISDEEERYAFMDWIFLSSINYMSIWQNWMFVDHFAKILLEKKKMNRNEVYEAFYDFPIIKAERKFPAGLNPAWLETNKV